MTLKRKKKKKKKKKKRESDADPAVLRRNVTSPNGTTERAIAFDEAGLSKIIARGGQFGRASFRGLAALYPARDDLGQPGLVEGGNRPLRGAVGW